MNASRPDTPAPAPAAARRPSRVPLTALARRTDEETPLLRRVVPVGKAAAPDVAAFNSAI
ncbi:hypothetical protein [Peterkaempfera griseoplana]|uniref:hypothetical protein n=1 Tax=Peterkaempfera griseoplana TaxID=66896 RepID=UPI0006E350B6|nr:hypothetical protein [Peterkaempfera griseoplana]